MMNSCQWRRESDLMEDIESTFSFFFLLLFNSASEGNEQTKELNENTLNGLEYMWKEFNV